VTPLQRLAQRLGHSWPHLEIAEKFTAETRARLDASLREDVPSDTSFVAFGSLARGEYTGGSDLDWTLLVDGQADGDHFANVQEITRILRREKFVEPGPTGVFGNFAFSHQIVHQIGGEDDTNKNITQRILLLVESIAIGQAKAHERVVRLVISRYVEEDRGLRFSRNAKRIPRFLLNDIVRYWRTMTIDFVNKQRERTDGWALRNAKLRMSRKLIFVSGLLTCFSPELFTPPGETWLEPGGAVSIPRVVEFLRERTRLTPLHQLAEAALRPAIQPATAKALFDEYDAFLGVLSDDDKRRHLKALTMDDLGHDLVFQEVARIGKRFQTALDQLFFKEDAELTQLIHDYGVF
jgi:predicted nucleotidyltransferase